MIVKAFHNNWFERPWSGLSLASRAAPFDAIRGELERLFSDQERALSHAFHSSTSASADFELTDEGPRLKVSANLPGLTRDNLELKLTEDRLTLRGERKLVVPEGFNARRQERQSYSFERSYRLPVKVDPDKAEANLSNGVLTVSLPKAEASKPRAITVHTS